MAAANRIAGASTCAAHANCSALLYLTHMKQHRPVALLFSFYTEAFCGCYMQFCACSCSVSSCPRNSTAADAAGLSSSLDTTRASLSWGASCSKALFSTCLQPFCHWIASIVLWGCASVHNTH